MKEFYEYFEDLDKKRDEAFKIGKEIIKLATKSIMFTFKKEFDRSEEIIKKALEKLKDFEKLFNKDLLILIGEFYMTVRQEVVEAIQFLSILKEKRIKSFEEINTGYIEYLNGTFDAIGELSRKMYDLLMKGNREDFLKFLSIIEEFYLKVFPISVHKFVPGLRYRVDLTRKKVEEFKRMLI